KDRDVAIPAASAYVTEDFARGEDGFGFGIFAGNDPNRGPLRSHALGNGRLVPMFFQILQSRSSLEPVFRMALQDLCGELDAGNGGKSFPARGIGILENGPGGEPGRFA